MPDFNYSSSDVEFAPPPVATPLLALKSSDVEFESAVQGATHPQYSPSSGGLPHSVLPGSQGPLDLTGRHEVPSGFGADTVAPATLGVPSGPALSKPVPPNSGIPVPSQQPKLVTPEEANLPGLPVKGPMMVSTTPTTLPKSYTTEPTFSEARAMQAQQVSDAVDENFPFLVGPIGRFYAGAIKTALQSVTDPVSGAVIAGTAGVSAVPGAAGRVIQTALSAYFAEQSGKAVWNGTPEVTRKIATGDYQGAAEKAGSVIADAAMGSAAAVHAFHGIGDLPFEYREAARKIADRFGPAKNVDGDVLQRIDPYAGIHQMGGIQVPPTYDAGPGPAVSDVAGPGQQPEPTSPEPAPDAADPQRQDATAQAWQKLSQRTGDQITPISTDQGLAYLQPQQFIISPAGISTPHEVLLDQDGEPLVAGTPDLVGSWLQQHATIHGVPPAPPAATEEPPTQPVYNSAEFIKAVNAWTSATTKAAAAYKEQNPDVPWDDAVAAVKGTVGRKPEIEDYKAPPQTPEQVAPKEEKPVKPATVQKPSAATPNAPTAATPTAPESPETIALQVQQLGTFGTPVQPTQRKAVMFPGGQGMPDLSTLGGLKITHDEFGNVYAYRPDLIDPDEIHRAAKNNTLPEVLGGPAGMGAPDKSALKGEPVAVVAHAADGTEAQTTVTDADHLHETLGATHAVTPAGGTVTVMPPEQALSQRPAMDELAYQRAVDLVRKLGKASTSTLQRNLRLGYGAASAMLDRMFAEGIIGPPNGSTPRNVIAQAISSPATPGTGKTTAWKNAAEPDWWKTAYGQNVKEPWVVVRDAYVKRVETDPHFGQTPMDYALDWADGRAEAGFDKRSAEDRLVSKPTATPYPPPSRPGITTTTALEPWFLGQHEGQPVTPERIADINDRIRNRPDDVVAGRGPQSVGDGESFNQFKDPLIAHTQKLIAEYKPGEKPLNVTHYRDIQALKAWLKAGAPATGNVDVAEMTRKGDQEPGGLYHLDEQAIADIQAGRKPAPDSIRPIEKATEPGIYFLRHGATEWNGENKGPSPNAGEQPGAESAEVFRGSSNINLSQQGVQEAHDVAGRTAGAFTKIYASPLKRAQDTAQIVADKNPQLTGKALDRSSIIAEAKRKLALQLEPKAPVKPLAARKVATAAKTANVDTSKFDEKSLEGRKQRDTAIATKTALSAEDAAAAQKMQERIAARRAAQSGLVGELSAPESSRHIEIDPDDLTDLTVMGAHQMLLQQADGNPTTFDSWSSQMMAARAPQVTGAAEFAGVAPDDVLRLTYDYASEVAKDYGVNAEPLPATTGVQSESGTGTTEQPAGPDNTAPLAVQLPAGDSGTPGVEPVASGSESGSGTSGDSQRAGAEQGPVLDAGGRIVSGVVGSAAEPEVTFPPRGSSPTSTTHDGDYRIPDGRVISGSPEGRARTNIAAIKLLRQIESEHRPATVQEQAILAGYVGWGAVPQLFAGSTPEFKALQDQLRALVSEQEYAEAQRSTTNAHYTGDNVVDAMWGAMQRFGAKPGMSWLEPAIGTGNFFGRQPEALLSGARRMGVEKDTLTGSIAKLLYPDSGVDVMPFEKAELPDGYFDVAISNVPFGNFGVHDSSMKKYLTSSIHNYFFAKALTLVRPGGVIGFVTSRYTLDGVDKPIVQFRQWMADRADFIGAVRLPAGAFRQNAGTDVIADVIFLRKRLPGSAVVGSPWVNTAVKSFPPPQERPWDGSTRVAVNEYFHQHPEMILGTEGTATSQYSQNQYDVKGNVTDQTLNEAIQRLEPNWFQEHTPVKASRKIAIRDLSSAGTAEQSKLGGLFFDSAEKLFRKTSTGSVEPIEVSSQDQARIKGQLAIRDELAKLMAAERNPESTDAQIDAVRRRLNFVYNGFVKANGFLSGRANTAAMTGDPDAPLLVSLERKYDAGNKSQGRNPAAEKAPILQRRMFQPEKPITEVSDPKDALYVSLNETGRIDWDRMSILTGRTPDQLQQDLEGLVYQNPKTRLWETADEYLSGSVRTKLRDARAVSKIEPGVWDKNVLALEAAQPEDIPPGDIRAVLGITWVPLDTYGEFAADVLGLTKPAKVNYVGGEWHVEVPWDARRRGASTEKWNTARVGAYELLKDALNMRRSTIYDTDSDGSRHVNAQETAAARAKQQEMQEHFNQWLFSDPVRGDQMARLYNDLNNDLRLWQADGSHLTLPGMVRDPLVVRGGDLEPHQKNAVWRVIKQKNVLLAHAVGTGKTFEAIAAGMELKRLGLIQRPMYVVPNATLGGWQLQFNALYPQARVLVFSEKDLEKSQRQHIMAQIATGDWDAVVVPHSSFQFLRTGDEVFEQHFAKLTAELEEAITAASEAGMDTRQIKRMEKAKERLLKSLEDKRKEEKKDLTVTWEQLGIDQLFVDESHEYKKLGFSTKQGNVAGIDQNGNQKTFDLLMKLRHTQTHGRGAVFLTGTPITNTMGEMFNLMKYLIEPDLEARGIAKFDEWSANYGRTVDVFEPKIEGGGYHMKARFSKFVNLPELTQLFRSFADVVTSDMVKLPIPEIIGGERRAIMTDLTDGQAEYLAELRERAEGIRRDPRGSLPDNMLAVYTDAQKMALDLRMVQPNAPDDPNGRLTQVADNVAKFWKESTPNKGTQLIMADMGKPASAGGSKDFSAYDDLIQKLVDRGIPRNEIATIYDAKNKVQRAKLFQDVNDGKVRVVLGSTMKMGVGVNVQDRLYAMHHLDIPHRPSDLEQREGRILRQGNTNPAVHILYYITKGSLDESKFGNVVRKGKFINAAMQGKSTVREAEDIDGMIPSLEMFQAMTSADPRVFRKLEVDAELDRLGAVYSAWKNQQWRARGELSAIPGIIRSTESRNRDLRDAVATRNATGRVWTVGNRRFEGEKITDDVSNALYAAADKASPLTTAERMSYRRQLPEPILIGSAYGLPIYTNGPKYIIGENELAGADVRDESEKGGTFQRIGYQIAHLDDKIANNEGIIATQQKNDAEYRSFLDSPWSHKPQYDKLVAEQQALIKELGADKGDDAANAMDAGGEVKDASVGKQDEEDDEPGEASFATRGEPIRPADTTQYLAGAAKVEQVPVPDADSARAVAYMVNPATMEVIHRQIRGGNLGYGNTARAWHFEVGDANVLGHRLLARFPNVPVLANLGREMLDRASDGRSTVIVNNSSAKSEDEKQQALRHELNHATQSAISGLPAKAHLISPDDLTKSPLGRRAADYLVAHGYPLNSGVLAAEIGVRLMAIGDSDLDLSLPESRSLAALYVTLLKRQYGHTKPQDIANRIFAAFDRLSTEGFEGKPDRLPDSARSGREERVGAGTPEDVSGPGIPNELQAQAGNEEQPRAGVGTRSSVTLGSGFGALQPGLEEIGKAGKQFVMEDVLPKVAKVFHSSKDLIDGMVHIFDPRHGVPTKILDQIYRMKGGREAAIFLTQKQLNQWSDEVGKLSQPEMVDFIDRIKKDQPQATDSLQSLAGFLREIDDTLYRDISEWHPTTEYKDNHYRVLWKVIPGSVGRGRGGFRGVFSRPLQGSKGFLRMSTLADMSEGLAKGGVPYSYNPIEMFKAHYADAMKYITAQRLWEDFRIDGTRKFVKFGQPPPDGFLQLKDPIVKAYFRVPQGTVDPGEWWLEPGAAHLLNNMLGRDYLRNVYRDVPFSQLTGNLGTAMLAVKNGTTAIELSWSPFHAVFVSIEAIGSEVGIGAREIWNLGIRGRDPKMIAKGAGTILTAWKAPVQVSRLGSAAKKAFGSVEEMKKTVAGRKWLATNPDAEANIQQYFNGGGLVGASKDLRLSAENGFKEYWNSAIAGGNPGHYLSALGRAYPALSRLVMSPLFDHLIPNLKLGFFLKEYPLAQREYADRLASGEMTLDQLSRQVVDSIENRFGEMNFDNLFWERTFKTFTQILTRSITWKLGNVRNSLGAVTGQVKELGRGAKEQNISLLDPKMAWLIGVALTTVAIATVIHRLSTGKLPEHLKDVIYPVIDPAAGIRISIPSYLRDFAHFKHDPVGYVTSSLSGELGKLAEIWQNRDFDNAEIHNEDDPLYKRRLDDLLHMVPLPFVASSYQRATQQGGNVASRASGFLGFTKAPRFIEQSAAEQLATTYAAGHREVGQRTAFEADKLRDENGIRNIFRRGGDAKQEIAAAISDGTITTRDVNRLQREAQRPAISGEIDRLSMPEALRVYNVATSEERNAIRRSVNNKVYVALRTPKEFGRADSDIRALAAKYFNVKPPVPHDTVPPAR